MGQGHDADCCCCDHSICVSAWSIAELCGYVEEETAPDCSNHAVPGAISGAVVEISRSYNDGYGVPVEELIDTCTTTGSGRCCIPIPLGLSDPTEAPTVDPVGGGLSGCLLTQDTYEARYSYRNPYETAPGFPLGETLASFPSGTFQVGVPDPAKVPFAAAMSVSTTGGRAGGGLDVGVYFARHTYANASGETTVGNLLKFRVGMLEPTTLWTLSGIGTGGALPAGTYGVRVAATDGTYHTNVVDYGTFTASAGDVFGLTAPPDLPYGCTGWTVWLTPNSGVHWYRYLHNVLPIFDVGYGSNIIPFRIAGTPFPVFIPSSNDFPVLDPRITFPASMATLRPYATEQRLYLFQQGASGGYRRYGVGILTPSFDLLLPYPSSGSGFPLTNGTARNIPRVTFPFGGTTSRVYAKSKTDGVCKYYNATASPKNLSGTPSGTGCSLERNSTRVGAYTLQVTSPGGVPADPVTIAIPEGCFREEYSFGFCDYQVQLNVTDHDGGDVSGWYVVGDEGHATYDETGLSIVRGLIPLAMTPCEFYDAEIEYDGQGYCGDGLRTGGRTIHHNILHLGLSAVGYHQRCVEVDVPCGIGATLTDVDVDLYSEANWILNSGCGPCTEVEAGGLVPEMIPRSLQCSFLGPEALTGTTAPVTATITYNDSTNYWEAWVTPGGWGYCTVTRADYQCKTPGADPYDPCASPITSFPLVALEKKFYGSARIRWVVAGDGVSSFVGGLEWMNFWGSGGDDTPPTCASGSLQAIGIWCSPNCPCGEIRPSGHDELFIGGTYNSKRGLTSALNSAGDTIGPTTTGNTCSIVNWHQSQNPVMPIGFNLCPGSPAPICEGTVTEL